MASVVKSHLWYGARTHLYGNPYMVTVTIHTSHWGHEKVLQSQKVTGWLDSRRFGLPKHQRPVNRLAQQEAGLQAGWSIPNCCKTWEAHVQALTTMDQLNPPSISNGETFKGQDWWMGATLPTGNPESTGSHHRGIHKLKSEFTRMMNSEGGIVSEMFLYYSCTLICAHPTHVPL